MNFLRFSVKLSQLVTSLIRVSGPFRIQFSVRIVLFAEQVDLNLASEKSSDRIATNNNAHFELPVCDSGSGCTS